MSDEERNAVNSLVTYLHSFEVVKLVEAHFAKYNNDAPPQLLREQINEVEKLLER
jgi:hypothetical protein